jgi:hypothetical protein
MDPAATIRSLLVQLQRCLHLSFVFFIYFVIWVSRFMEVYKIDTVYLLEKVSRIFAINY